MKSLRTTIRKMLVENYLGAEAKVVELLIADLDESGTTQGMMLGEDLGFFTISEDTLFGRTFYHLKNLSPAFQKAYEERVQNEITSEFGSLKSIRSNKGKLTIVITLITDAKYRQRL